MDRERRRKLLALLLSAVMACVMAGCGQKTESITEAAAVSTADCDRTGKYSIHTFTLPEGISAVAKKVAEIAPELKMSPFTIYVNPAFIRYVTGTDHQ